jgi:hypothetical protein
MQVGRRVGGAVALAKQKAGVALGPLRKNVGIRRHDELQICDEGKV